MIDTAQSSAKPTANDAVAGCSVNGGGDGGPVSNRSFPVTKAQLYGSTGPVYRRTRRRHCYQQSCCPTCCECTILTILIPTVLVGAIYLKHPLQLPAFTVSSLNVATFNLTSSSTVATAINLNVAGKNPNKNLVYHYDPIAASIATGDGVAIGDGSIPGFTQRGKNTTLLKFAIKSSGAQLDDAAVSKLRSQMRSKSGVLLKIELETRVKAKMGALSTPQIRIRVTYEGIKASPPSGKTPSTANAKCKVGWRLKIWKWTF